MKAKHKSILLIALASTLLLGSAWADDDEGERGGRKDRGGGRMSDMMTKMPAIVKQECAACHIVYPPNLLTKSSWQSIMGNLSKHYGTDASIDPKSVQEISQWLEQNAGNGWRRIMPNPPENRITKSAWFIGKHDEVSSSVWARPSVKSASNCMACHAGAEQGNFNEHAVRIPK